MNKGQTNDNSLANLIPFEKGKSGNPNGRPRKFVTTVKAQGYKVSEINDTIQILMALTINELKAVAEDPQATILEVIISRALHKDAIQGKVNSLESILSRVFGSPKQSFEGTVVEQPFFPDVKYDNIDDAEIEED